MKALTMMNDKHSCLTDTTVRTNSEEWPSSVPVHLLITELIIILFKMGFQDFKSVNCRQFFESEKSPEKAINFFYF